MYLRLFLVTDKKSEICFNCMANDLKIISVQEPKTNQH